MSFFNKLQSSSNEFMNKENKPALMPEGVNIVRIEELVEKETQNGGKCLHISVKSQSENWGKIFINTEHSNENVVAISLEEFKRILVQVAPDARLKFSSTQDYSVLEGSFIDVVCKHEMFNGSKYAKLTVCREAAALAYTKLGAESLIDGNVDIF